MRSSCLFRSFFISLVVWLIAANGFSDQQPTLYVSQPFEFQLEIPHQWSIHQPSQVEVQTLAKAAEEATSPEGTEVVSDLVVIFSEFPLGASVPFNTNITISVHPLDSAEAQPDALLQRASSHLLGDQPPGRASTTHQEDFPPITWAWADYRYEQTTGKRRVPIQARLAVTLDPSHQRYVLITASAQDDLFAQHVPLFQECVRSFRWKIDGS